MKRFPLKKKYQAALFFLLTGTLFSQEALKSTEEEYYDFLSLQGITSRPSLNYRTLSDSVWNIGTETKTVTDEDGTETTEEQPLFHPWQGNNLGRRRALWQPEEPSKNGYLRGVPQGVFLKWYGPEWYNSFNTASPYGQNDGALWQGKGYNTSLTAGARLEAYGLEVTVKPQVSFSQNLGFELMKSNYDSEFGYFWGYDHNVGIDAPQRFGDKPFFTFDWGDTEIRYTWKTLTIGFGTQTIWLGPAYLNPILHSNNAPTYPKFDIGLRRQRVVIPGLNWYLGDVEARVWIGYLSQSDYFSENTSNPHNQITCFTFSYAPSFLPGLTIGVAKICLSKWGENFWKYLNPMYDSNETEDQKASIMFDWVFPSIGFEVYGELGIDDYLQGGMLYGNMRYPFDTLVWTCGLKKTFTLAKSKSVYGEVIAEVSVMELPRNKGKQCYYAFNFHHLIIQGYTNKGQYIGSMLGNGGNSQILLFNLYYPKGKSSFLIGRNNPDNTFSYNTLNNHNETYKANFIVDFKNLYYITESFSVTAGIGFDWIINAAYYEKNETEDIIPTRDIYNFNFRLELKYSL